MTVGLDAALSSAEAGVVSYDWFTNWNGSASTTKHFTTTDPHYQFTLTKAGMNVVGVTITDGRGMQDTQRAQVFVY